MRKDGNEKNKDRSSDSTQGNDSRREDLSMVQDGQAHDQAAEAQQQTDKPKQKNKKSDDKDHKEQNQEPSYTLTQKIKRCFFTLLNIIYTYFYFVGIQLLRSTRVKRRHLLHTFHRFVGMCKQRCRAYRRRLAIWGGKVRRGITQPFYELREEYRQFCKDVRNARLYGSKRRVFHVYRGMAGVLLGGIFSALKVVFNYAAPVAGVVLLVFTIQYFNNLTLALRVEYNGRDIGYIIDESVFNQAENEMKGRIINETYIKPEDVIPRFELQAVDQETLLTVDELTNQLIQASGNALAEADGLYIQDRFVSAVTDGQGLLLYLNQMLERHRTVELDDTAQINFIKKVQVKRGLYPVSSIKPLNEVTALLEREEKGERKYTVTPGDDGLSIAAKNGISFRELKALNPEVDVSLMPGDELLISQSVPYLGAEVTTTIQYEEEIPFKITQKTDPARAIGWTQITQKGKEGLRKITAEVKMRDGIEVERTVVNTQVVEAPVDQILVVGGNKPLKVIPSYSGSGSVASGAFGWPAARGSITTGFLDYYGHTGSDITWSGCYGGEIYAAADGMVVASGWGGMYGYRVIINHGGNVQTLYAHCSRLAVGVGTPVKQGQLIGYIGRTGNTTGPHLHFEIRINGRPVNPAPYLYS